MPRDPERAHGLGKDGVGDCPVGWPAKRVTTSLPAAGEYGVIVVTGRYEPATGHERMRIGEAAPRARLTRVVADKIRNGECRSWASLTGDRMEVLTLTDDHGQRFIYRLGQYNESTDSFDIEWPD